jgi:hypothetical protein
MTTDAHGESMSGTSAHTTSVGFKISTNYASTLTKITKDGNSTATRALLLNSGKTILVTASFSGNDATFSYDLDDDTVYYVVVDSSGSSHSYPYGLGPPSGNYPISGTNIDWEKGKNRANPDDNGIYAVASVTTLIVTNITVSPSALSLSLAQPSNSVVIQASPLSLDSTLVFFTPQIITTESTGTLTIGTGSRGTRFIRTSYPNEEGLTAGTQRQTGRTSNLVREGITTVPLRNKIGLG